VGSYKSVTPSDGLTLDTPYGRIDTVAVQRAADGHRVPLTFHERRYIYLNAEHWDTRQRTNLADALGITLHRLEIRFVHTRKYWRLK
jgi:hypothetical protein